MAKHSRQICTEPLPSGFYPSIWSAAAKNCQQYINNSSCLRYVPAENSYLGCGLRYHGSKIWLYCHEHQFCAATCHQIADSHLSALEASAPRLFPISTDLRLAARAYDHLVVTKELNHDVETRSNIALYIGPASAVSRYTRMHARYANAGRCRCKIVLLREYARKAANIYRNLRVLE